ncbi:flavin-containing amine oxidoreductase [Durotheca rogersii]|uniref:flavin-containing amine oxidoreductase n=1 Tax=Durotheca rogersii TaxID=419775 RepID=UPI002220DE0F|nr:flavin-containing amine oxidoreductase [Durotheca rogersii]KAI5860302.1 flavin-containing amine oxidoreductase [Durotheca rogersii]
MFWISLFVLAGQVAPATASQLPVKLETRSELDSRLANVHVSFEAPLGGVVTYTYGRCDSTQLHEAHHTIFRGAGGNDSRLVWILPDDAGSDGCISAWDERGSLVGRSEPQRLSKRTLKRHDPHRIEMTSANGIDAWGPWFDGVELLKNKNHGGVDVAKAKSKDVVIVGAGMSGLMTYLVLHQAGLTNISIVEATQRLGGRVHTEYLSGGPFDYSYQEMGPMRFPETAIYSNQTYNITDHQMVFQLAREMNRINNYDRNLSVDFIPWIQSNPNGLYYYDGIKLDTGLPPTRAQIAADPSLQIIRPLDPSTQALSDKISTITSNETFMIEVATNMFRAHRDFLVNGLGGLGGDTWSEFAYMVNYLKATLNDTDVLGGGAATFWDAIYEGVYFGATTWKTIDGGLNRLPLSFHPLVDNVTALNRKIERVQWFDDARRVNLQWRNNYTDTVFQNASYDYAVFALPFSIVKKFRLPYLPRTITNAINNLPFASACKVALEYSSRFWEHYENPIVGGCSTATDIPGIGSICYPSYGLSGNRSRDGPASLLASYATGDWATRWASVPEDEHVRYVLDAMAEIHGPDAYKLYTGNYRRRCWVLDPYEGGGWASPTVGQHQLYLPEYFRTYNNMIFVGEQTSYTHAWISSALESGIRGGVQLLLELGLVDEAKDTVRKWMARWISVVSPTPHLTGGM